MPASGTTLREGLSHLRCSAGRSDSHQLRGGRRSLALTAARHTNSSPRDTDCKKAQLLVIWLSVSIRPAFAMG